MVPGLQEMMNRMLYSKCEKFAKENMQIVKKKTVINEKL
jgi:hypothetical protein